MSFLINSGVLIIGRYRGWKLTGNTEKHGNLLNEPVLFHIFESI